MKNLLAILMVMLVQLQSRGGSEHIQHVLPHRNPKILEASILSYVIRSTMKYLVSKDTQLIKTYHNFWNCTGPSKIFSTFAPPLLQSSHFLHKIHSNVLPLGEVVLGGNENLYKKNFFVIKVSLPWEWYGSFDEIWH